MKKIIALVLTLTLVLALAACSGSADDKTIVVGATPAPHAEILEIAKEILAEEGYTLEIKEFDDYIIPNTSLEEGELDANYFQHITYMNNFNEENGTHLVSAAGIHYEPFGLYAGKTASLDALADGAQIAVPNDGTNEARALLLLEQEGLIKLKEGVDMAVINGNYAIDAGLKVSEALAVENADGAAAEAYVNVVAVKEGNENSEKIQALIKALQSEEVRTFIEETYEGAVVPLF